MTEQDIPGTDGDHNWYSAMALADGHKDLATSTHDTVYLFGNNCTKVGRCSPFLPTSRRGRRRRRRQTGRQMGSSNLPPPPPCSSALLCGWLADSLAGLLGVGVSFCRRSVLLTSCRRRWWPV